MCRCSNVSTLKLNNIPIFYRNLIHSWSKFNNNLQQSSTIDEILEQRLFSNSNITFQNKPICFASFVKSNIKTIKDIWSTIENDFKNCNEIYNSLNDKRNCISEYARIKKAVPKEFVKISQGEIAVDLNSNRGHFLKLNRDLYLYDKMEKIILPFQLELKSIHQIINKKIKPICQIKWEALYGEDINWEQVWSKLKQVHVSNKIKEFQWKCIHNIIYTENRLQKMNMSNGKCHLCQVDNNNETLQHLFFQCPSAKIIMKEMEDLLKNFDLEIPRKFREKDIMLGYHEGDNLDIINIIIYIFKWELWKIRNKIKHNGINLGYQVIRITWRRNFHNNLDFLLKTNILNNIEKDKLTIIRNKINE